MLNQPTFHYQSRATWPVRLALLLTCACVVALAPQGMLRAQQPDAAERDSHAEPALPQNMVVPQVRAFAVAEAEPVEITRVVARVDVVERVATTQLDVHLSNSTSRMQEATLLLPVPAGAVVRGFDFDGEGAEPSAQLLPHAEAVRTYRAIVSRMIDPALLEFAGHSWIRSSVFPVPAEGAQLVRVTYEQVLQPELGHVEYVLPRSESLGYRVPWEIRLRLASPQPLATLYSPSHNVDIRRTPHGEEQSESDDAQQQARGEVVSAILHADAQLQPGAFRFCWAYAAEDGDAASAAVFAYPDDKDGGYFLLAAGLPLLPESATHSREVTLVLDVSGSMRGEKFNQAIRAMRSVLAGLEDGEAFNLIAFSSHVTPFAEAPVILNDETRAAAEAWISRQQAGGMTALYGALELALSQPATEGKLPLVLFLTDGIANVGESSERGIRALVKEANPASRRVFTFGVGYDVNAPLLDGIALDSRAYSTYVQPQEDVEAAVDRVFRGLDGPVLADLTLTELDESGEPAQFRRTQELMPQVLPDMYRGESLTLVGRYRGNEPVRLRLSGTRGDGETASYDLELPLASASTRNGFVPRLWASRRIGELTDAIIALGADATPQRPHHHHRAHPNAPQQNFRGNQLPRNAQRQPQQPRNSNPHPHPQLPPEYEADPRLAELVGEIIYHSIKYGILTEYTAFLAREGTPLLDANRAQREAMQNFQDRGWYERSGQAGVNQSMNSNAQRAQSHLNYRNEYYDRSMQRVEITSVQQVNDRAFFRFGERWVDSRLLRELYQQLEDDAQAAEGEAAEGEAREDEADAEACEAEAAEFALPEPTRTVVIGSDAYFELLEQLTDSNRQGVLALDGKILLLVGDEVVLITPPSEADATEEAREENGAE